MKFSAILFGAALYLFSSVEAGISTNTPFSSITWNGGDTEKIVWVDDGKAPKLPELGLTTVELMAGGDKNQVTVAKIGAVLATAKQIEYKVPKNVGPPGDFYFIRYTSANGGLFFSGLFSIKNVNGNIKGFDPKSPNTAAPAAPNNATITPNNATTTPNNTTAPATGNPSTGNAGYGSSGYSGTSGTSGYGNSNTTPPAKDASSSPSPVPTAPATSNANTNANTNALPNSISSSDASNSIPNFAGVATAVIAFAFTYLY